MSPPLLARGLRWAVLLFFGGVYLPTAPVSPKAPPTKPPLPKVEHRPVPLEGNPLGPYPMTVSCCGISPSYAAGIVQTDPTLFGPGTQWGVVKKGCMSLEVASKADLHGILYVEDRPVREFQISEARSCKVALSPPRGRWVDGNLALGEVPGIYRGMMLGCGRKEPFDRSGHVRLWVLPEECELRPMAFLEGGATVLGEALSTKGDAPLAWSFVPSTVLRLHPEPVSLYASLERSPEGATVELSFGDPYPAIARNYAEYLKPHTQILSIASVPVNQMSGAEFVEAAGRLLASIEDGAPLPYAMQEDP